MFIRYMVAGEVRTISADLGVVCEKGWPTSNILEVLRLDYSLSEGLFHKNNSVEGCYLCLFPSNFGIGHSCPNTTTYKELELRGEMS